MNIIEADMKRKQPGHKLKNLFFPKYGIQDFQKSMDGVWVSVKMRLAPVKAKVVIVAIGNQ